MFISSRRAKRLKRSLSKTKNALIYMYAAERSILYQRILHYMHVLKGVKELQFQTNGSLGFLKRLHLENYVYERNKRFPKNIVGLGGRGRLNDYD